MLNSILLMLLTLHIITPLTCIFDHFSFRSEQDVMYEVKQNYITLRTQLLLPFVLESCVVASPGSAQRTGTSIPSKTSLTPTLPSTPAPTPSPTSAPLCPTIRNAYSTLLRVAQMEVQLFDSLFRTPDDDEIKHDEGLAVGNGGGGGGGGMSSKAKGSSLEVVSIIESICNATGKTQEMISTVISLLIFYITTSTYTSPKPNFHSDYYLCVL